MGQKFKKIAYWAGQLVNVNKVGRGRCALHCLLFLSWSKLMTFLIIGFYKYSHLLTYLLTEETVWRTPGSNDESRGLCRCLHVENEDSRQEQLNRLGQHQTERDEVEVMQQYRHGHTQLLCTPTVSTLSGDSAWLERQTLFLEDTLILGLIAPTLIKSPLS